MRGARNPVRSLPSRCCLSALLAGVAFVCSWLPADAADENKPRVTRPKAHFGFDLGDDYCLANYEQYTEYLSKLEKESERIKVVSIGTTSENRQQLMAIVTSPSNHKKLTEYRTISSRLANAAGVTAGEAERLAANGKAVVWIDGGLHASEVLGSQALAETIYRFVSSTDPETLRILDDVIILFVQANPDGMDLCSDWYMREKDPRKRTLATLPRLYQKYTGHDNNRDFYANTQVETRNMNRVLYREWYPQIVYDHHQTGPPGAVLFCPPFRDPFNYNLDPLVIAGTEALGTAMMQRFLAEDKPGATTRSGAFYTAWWNGGLRTTCNFHNMIGLLTETIGHPTPAFLPLFPSMQVARTDMPAPAPPQLWRFRQSVEYSVTANQAVLNYASRHREELLHNIWLMGRRSIERGSGDSWTITPKMAAAAKGTRNPADYQKFFRDPAKRDARGYILPADQPDFPTATRFVNALIGTGVRVLRAKAAFEVGGRKYPAGSYVVKCAQAFRPHVLDMFEPQDHPDDILTLLAPGTPTPLTDAVGYTLALQMGIVFDRILEAFDGPFEEVKEELPPPPAQVVAVEKAVGFYLKPNTNNSFGAVNQLLAAGEEVQRLKAPLARNGEHQPPGTYFVKKKEQTLSRLEKIASALGTEFVGTAQAPEKEAVALKPVRIALWDRFGGSMASGWTRWLLEQFEFPFVVVYPPDLDKGGLREKFDLILLVDGAIGWAGGAAPEVGFVDELGLPAEYRGRRGSISITRTFPHLKRFVEDGGTLLAIGSSTVIGPQLEIPIVNHLVARDADNRDRPLGRDKFFIPPSIISARLDPAHPLAWGMGEKADMVFASSPTYRLLPDAAIKGVSRVAWFDGKAPLRSGWALGQEFLDGGVAIVDARVGNGRVVMYGPPALFRGQSHGTFKLVFNAIIRAGEKQ